MPVPDFQTLMLPVLRFFADGATNIADCLPRLRQEFDISDDEAAELLPSGRITYLQNRAHWARTYLSKAGLLESPKRNQHVITEKGRQLLRSNPSRIDIAVLESFDGFTDWRDHPREDAGATNDALPRAAVSTLTPEDSIAQAHGILNAALRDELLALLQDISPVRFERLILDLLTAMGYGGGDLSNSHMTRSSGDNGIDGIIHEDALGLDAVYVQAKRYAPENKVSRPAIQQFVGSLTGEGATKGVFVTTSDFSREAQEYLRKVQHRIVLINGQALANLMVKHDVGVRARTSFVIKTIDDDYFGNTSTD